ncbi:MAG: UbiA-like polyprenyltransferase [Saprospiraceae bacterium]
MAAFKAAIIFLDMLQKYLSLVKFSHTIFAMPFAIVGFLLGISFQSHFDWYKLLLIILSMVFARSAAMAFNRYLDSDIDALNERTKIREIPSGVLSSKNVLLFTILNCMAFVVTTWFINHLCFQLSFVALAVILGYSYTKRFTPLCHFVLGLGLSLAPIGAFLAVTGKWDYLPILYSITVLTWVSGFDIIYALQDYKFDLTNNLKSIPVLLGIKNALLLSRMLHIISGLVLIYATNLTTTTLPLYFHNIIWIGTSIFIGLLFYQHTLVKHNNLQKVNLAFFTTNGIASVLFSLCFILDWLIK